MEVDLEKLDEQAKSELKNQLCLLAETNKIIEAQLNIKSACMKELAKYLCPFKVGDVITNNNNFYSHAGSSFKVREVYLTESFNKNLQWKIRVNLIKKDGTLGREIKIEEWAWRESKQA